MPAPAPIFALQPAGWNPGLIPVDDEQGGRGGGGLTPNPIRGISIAFGSAHNAEAPLWQNILELGE